MRRAAATVSGRGGFSGAIAGADTLPAPVTAATLGGFADATAAVEFAVHRSAASADAATVRWTARAAPGDGAATLEGAGSDRETGQARTGTVVFAANDGAAKTVGLATADGDLVEGLNLHGDIENGEPLPDGGSISAAGAAGTGTITDNDEAVMIATVSIADADPATEGTGPARFTVSLSRAVGSDVALDISYTASSAGLEDGAASGLPRRRSRPAPPRPPSTCRSSTTTSPRARNLHRETLPGGVAVADGIATGTIMRTLGPRFRSSRAGLRRERSAASWSRFDSVAGTVVRNRLSGNGTHNLTLSMDVVGVPPGQGGQQPAVRTPLGRLDRRRPGSGAMPRADRRTYTAVWIIGAPTATG